MTTLTLYTAPWCQPCKRAIPLVRQFAEQHHIPLEIVDIDADPAAANAHAVRGVPTIVCGVRRHAGSVPTISQLKELVSDD